MNNTPTPGLMPVSQADEFKREERYIVIKRKHLGREGAIAFERELDEMDIPRISAVVVESDWPEYEAVWEMIEDRVSVLTRHRQPASHETLADEQLARFGHHPEPAIDFCIEVESLESIVADKRLGLRTDEEWPHERIAKAMEFRVGADENCVVAKQALRKLEDSLRTEGGKQSSHTAGEGVAKDLERAIERLAGISTERMEGDNLAILLCSHFENPDQEVEDDTGWTPDAVEGFHEVEKAFREHFAPILATLSASQSSNGAGGNAFCNKCGFYGAPDERGNHNRPKTGEPCPYTALPPATQSSHADLLEALEEAHSVIKELDDMWSDDGEGGRVNPIEARSGQVREIWQKMRSVLSRPQKFSHIEPEAMRKRGQDEGMRAVLSWLRDRGATKPRMALWQEAATLADQFEDQRIPRQSKTQGEG